MSIGATGGIHLNNDAANGSKFQVKPGRGNNPVVFVSSFDAMRFVNWLENGQRAGSTETGVYAMGNGVSETRSLSATYFAPSENEWYKAAYHKNDGATGNYWDYPTSTDAVRFSAQPPGSAAPTPSNVANYYRRDLEANGYNDGFAVTGSWEYSLEQNYLTEVGAYSESVSPYGTFDQGGNVAEWNEGSSSLRGARGAGWKDQSGFSLSASNRREFNPGYQVRLLGFRVASLPQPNSADFDIDGDVDGADSLIWQRGLGAPGPGDANDDHLVDDADLAIWREQFASPIAAQSVPEPQSLLMTVVCSYIASYWSCRRR